MPDVGLYGTLAAASLVCWPPLVRPLLDGDTLLYHLPDAVAFAQAHSVWTAVAPYWPYPAASEIFAAGLFAVSGPWSLPLCGIVPALLLTARIYRVARTSNMPSYCASAIALAFICTPVAAFQVGTLQNDLWLAAFFVEVVTFADRSPLSLAVCAMLKPFGWLEGVIAAFAARFQLRTLLLASIPLLVWIGRDGILLLEGAKIGVTAPAYLPSAIAGNLAIAVPQLAHGVSAVTPQAFVWLAALVAGLAFSASRRYAVAGIATLVVYAFLPVSYRINDANYTLDASSFRYALPALACGALAAATLSRKFAREISVAAFAIFLWGSWSVLALFWNDAYTRYAILAAALAIAAAAATARTRGIAPAALLLAAILVGRWAASSRAAGFYADWMRDPSGNPTGVFSWIAQERPPAIAAQNVRLGAIFMMSPRTRALEVTEPSGCTLARRDGMLFLVGRNEGLAPAQMAKAFANARACGAVLYQDGAAIVVKPRR